MKQVNEFARSGIDSGDVRTLRAITVRTGESEILRRGFSLMLLGDDVIDLERQRKRGLRDAAVFAASSRPLSNQPSQLTVHGSVDFSFRF